MTDTALLRKWQRTHDADTFVEIVSRHSAMVYATCQRILRNTADAEDVTQDCFAELVRSGANVERSLGGWLHTLATHRSLNRIRADRRREDREARFAQQRPTATQPDWDDVQEHVDEAIASLPEELREAVVHRFLYGETHDAIARNLGISRSTVLRRIEKGTAEVRRVLERRGVVATATGLAALMAANMAEAAPASLTAALGKLALASSAGNAVAGTTSAAWVAKALGGALVMKKTVAVVVAVVAVVGGIAVLSQTIKTGRPVPEREPIPDRRQAENSEERSTAPGADQDSGDQAQPAEATVGGAGSWGVVSGRVYDAETGEGISGIVVTAFMQKPRVWRESEPTDETGHYAITRLPAGEYKIGQEGDARYLSWLPDYAVDNATRAGNQPPPRRMPIHVRLRRNQTLSGVDMALGKGVQVAGRVVDWDGNPVAGARVHADVGQDYALIWSTETDEAGAFAFKTALEPTDALTLDASKKGFNGFARIGPFPLQSDRKDIEIVLTQTRNVAGVVLDGDRKPIPGLEVSASPRDKARGQGRHSEPTDRKGRFEVAGVTPGVHDLRIFRPTDHDTFVELPGGMEVAVPANRDLTGIQLIVDEAGATLQGRVTDPSGRPVAGAYVGFDNGMLGSSAQTESDGSFEMTHLPPNPGTVSVSKDWYFSQTVYGAAVGGAPLTVTLTPFAGVEVQVLDGATGKPLSNYELAWVKGFKDNVDFAKPLAFEQVDDSSGRFLVKQMEFAKATFIARAAGFVPAHKSVQLLGQRSIVRVQLPLPAGGTVFGEVIDAEGDPVQDALVSAGLPPIEEDREGLVAVATDADGRFELAMVSPNTTAICAQHAVFGFGQASLSASTSLSQNVQITLSEPAGVEGVVTVGGAPIRSATVHVAELFGAEPDTLLATHTDSNGQYAFAALPAGNVTLTVRYSGKHRHLVKAATIAAGQTTTVNLDFAAATGSVEGTVTLDGAPVAKAVVDAAAMTASGQEYFHASADESGAYCIDGLPTGSVQIRASTIERDPFDFGTFTVEIKEGEVARQDFAASL